MIENFRPGGLARFGLDYDTVAAGNEKIVYASISGFGTGAGADFPGYDLMVQAISGLMSLTGDPDGPPYRAGISVFDVMAGLHASIGILAALHHRGRDRAGPARRGQPAQLRAVRPGQPLQRLRRRRHRPVPDGQRAPQPLPVRAAAHRGRRADRHRRQRRAVPQALPGARPARPCPTTRASGATRTARPTASSCGRCWSNGSPSAPRTSGSATCSPRACPCAPINTIDGGVALAQELGLDPVVAVGDVPRRSATRSPSPTPRPGTSCRRPGSTNTARRSARG